MRALNKKAAVNALLCDDVSVRFPLVSSANRWRLFFGKAIDSWHEALNDVSLSVGHGKIIGVIGRNGAGKSTLLRTLAGVYPLNRGKVVRLGAISALFELGGFGGLLITGRQYVERWLRLNGVPKRQWPVLIDEIQEFSELAERFEDRIFTYSAGMAARLYFSTATSVGHEIYLIDEVLSVGDEHFQAKCWKRVRDRLAGGVSGVLVTHDWSAILRLCEQTCELEAGQIVASGDSERVICDYLKLSDQLDPNRLARFSDDCPISVHSISGEDWVCDIPIATVGNVPVLFNYSVERLVLGQDWQIIFFGEEVVVSCSPGKYLARIKVTELQLNSGEYRLNLFLYGAKTKDNTSPVQFDMRCWTTGNSVKLSVAGSAGSGLVSMPLLVECV